MNTLIRLDELSVGEIAVVRKLHLEGDIRRRLQDIGLIEGTLVECLGKSPSGDPHAYLVRGAVIAIRATNGRQVLMSRLDDGDDSPWD